MKIHNSDLAAQNMNILIFFSMCVECCRHNEKDMIHVCSIHICNSSTFKAEAGGFKVQLKPGSDDTHL